METPSLEETKIKLPSVRVGIGTLFTIVVCATSMMGGIFWLWSDKHNNEIFLPRAEYQKDQQYMFQTMKDIKFSQDESRTDIKQILKDSKK